MLGEISVMLAERLFNVIATIWLCTEIGEFVQKNASWEAEMFFWPFWTCLVLALVIGVNYIDQRRLANDQGEGDS